MDYNLISVANVGREAGHDVNYSSSEEGLAFVCPEHTANQSTDY